MKRIFALLALLALTAAGNLSGLRAEGPSRGGRTVDSETIVLGGGCFWCLEAVFQELRGVLSVRPGYAGGTVPRPTYERVCTGETGHAEVVEVTFDPRVLPLESLLEVFFALHDPTTKDRQGADVGSQYRSIVLYRDGAQRRAAEEAIRRVEASGAYPRPVVTEVVPLEAFYPAEEYHRDYFRKHPDAPYCALVISPKLAKLKRLFKDRTAP
jgi:peptide-methionine (S)-S-oxide reductase